MMNSTPKGRSLPQILVIAVSILLTLPVTALAVNLQTVPDYAADLMAISNDGSLVALTGRTVPGVNSPDGMYYPIDVFEVSSGTLILSIEEVWTKPNSLDFSLDHQYLIYSTEAGNVNVIDLSTGNITNTLFYGGVVTAIGAEWNPIDNQVAFSVGTVVNTINGITNTDSFALRDSENRAIVTALAWSSDGSELASTTFSPQENSARIQIWNMANTSAKGTLLLGFEGGGGLDIAWSPDDSKVASATRGTVTVYDSSSGQQLSTFSIGDDLIFSVAFSPDGTEIAAGSSGAVWIWDVVSQQLVRHIVMEGRVSNISWTPDSQHVLHNGGSEGLYIDGIPMNQVAVPTVIIDQSIIQSDPTDVAPITFSIVFSESVTGFDASDIDLSTSTASGTLTAVVTGSGANYTVEVSGMTGDGTVVASIPANAAQNAAGVGNTASTSTDNCVTYDATAPTVTVNQASTQADPTNTGNIEFTVEFSEPVTGFDAADVSLTRGSVSSIQDITSGGVGLRYSVLVGGMASDGAVVASIPANAVQDAAGNPSNIIVVYNHLDTNQLLGYEADQNPGVGDSFEAGDSLRTRVMQSENNDWPHLHLEVFYTADGTVTGNAIRINPLLFFSQELVEKISDEMGPYYPLDKIVQQDEYRHEWAPAETNDPAFTNQIDRWDYTSLLSEEAEAGIADYDLGIDRGEVTEWLPVGDIPDRTSQNLSYLVWTRTDDGGIQNIETTGPEWFSDSYLILTVADLISRLQDMF